MGIFSNAKVLYKIGQEITTELSGNCGMSIVPINKDLKQDSILLEVNEKESCLNLDNFREYLKVLENMKIGINITSLIGHGTVRNYIAGSRRK